MMLQPPRREDSPDGIRLIPNLEYADIKGKSLLLDLYLPETIDKPAPVIVYVHGGGWIGGDKHEVLFGIELVKRGYAMVSINYRFSNEAVYPAQIYDCKAAVRWVRAHSKFYNLDGAHIGAWGASAGGHLVALLGTTGGVKELEGDEGNPDQSSKVQAVCDWFGPTDFSKINEEYGQTGMQRHSECRCADSLVVEADRSGDSGGEGKRHKRRIPSPLSRMTRRRFSSCTATRISSFRWHKVNCCRLQQTGVEAKLDVVKGVGHAFLGADSIKRVGGFFDAHLKPAPATGPSGK